PSAPSLRDDEFALFQALIRREAGIALNDQKKPLLVSRLAPRLRALGLHTFTDYYGKVTGPDAASELVRMLDCICTNETRFFREPAQFELLEREVIPSWMHGRPRPIRARSPTRWRCRCCTTCRRRASAPTSRRPICRPARSTMPGGPPGRSSGPRRS